MGGSAEGVQESDRDGFEWLNVVDDCRWMLLGGGMWKWHQHRCIIRRVLFIPAKDCRNSTRIFNGFGLVWFFIGHIASME